MRISSPVPARRARLEIIPLIDIMFFLLASFMMVSIHMIHLRALKMDLPSPVGGTASNHGFVRLEVDPLGDAYLREGGDRRRLGYLDLLAHLKERRAADPEVRAFIQGAPKSTHGQVMAILDLCRQAGIEDVSMDVSEAQNP